MKHILPILTLTTLAAAASAQAAAPAAGLSYNRIGFGYNTNTKGYSLSGTALLGSSNFIIGATTGLGNGGSVLSPNYYNGVWSDRVSLGYLVKNVAYGIDAVATYGSDEYVNVNFRKDIGNNLEVAAGYSRARIEDGAVKSGWDAELAYNVSKQIQLAVGYSDFSASSGQTTLSARYNF
jgi:hypothetical protein